MTVVDDSDNDTSWLFSQMTTTGLTTVDFHIKSFHIPQVSLC